MKTAIRVYALAFMLFLAATVDARPPDYAITFEIHETVGEPTSDVDFTVTMGLMEDERDGDDIGWDIVVITIREMDGSTVVETWLPFRGGIRDRRDRNKLHVLEQL